MSMIKFLCEKCGKSAEAFRSPSSFSKKHPRFCSLICLGKSQLGLENSSYDGGRHILSIGHGAILIPERPKTARGGYTYKRRLIAAEKMGRTVKTDNRPEKPETLGGHYDRLKEHPALRGDKHPMAKLNVLQINEIKLRHSNGEKQSILASAFSVSRSQICNIVNVRQWRDL